MLGPLCSSLASAKLGSVFSFDSSLMWTQTPFAPCNPQSATGSSHKETVSLEKHILAGPKPESYAKCELIFYLKNECNQIHLNHTLFPNPVRIDEGIRLYSDICQFFWIPIPCL